MIRFIFIRNLNHFRLLSIFILGLIVGSALTNFFIGSQVDRLSIERDNIYQSLKTFESENQELKESLKKQKLIVTAIEPSITFTDDSLTSYTRENYSLQITKTVEELLSSLKGKDVDGIDYMLIPGIIEDRIISIDGKKFVLHVKTIILSRKLFLDLEASNYIEN
ncbi:MAG: hypothetical protein AB1420_12110 [Bacillota bacterium]